MDNSHEFDKELLSAYADDVLSDSERRQVEDLLASNHLAARYLDSIRSTRNSLKTLASVGSGANASRKLDLASRVIALAQAEAAQQKLPSSHHVLAARTNVQHAPLPSSSIEPLERAVATGRVVRDEAAQKSRSRTALWVSIAAAAAAVLLVVTLVTRDDNFSGEGLISGVTGKTDTSRNDDDKLAVDDQSDLPKLDPFSESRSDSQPGRTSVLQGSAIVSDGNRQALDDLKMDLQGPELQLDVLFIFDVVISRDAWDKGRFGDVLEQTGIPLKKNTTADKELVAAIVDNRMASVGDSQVAGQVAADLAMLFVQCSGATFEKLTLAVGNDTVSFPQSSYDIAIDSKQQVLTRLLRAASSKNGKASENAATLIVPEGVKVDEQSLMPAFVSFEKWGESRPATKSMTELRPSDQVPAGITADVLVLLRRAKE